MARISTRGGMFVAALVTTGFVLGAGCKEDKKTPAAGSAGSAGSATAAPGSAAPGSAAAGSAAPAEAAGSGAVAPAAAPATGDHLGLLPKDSEIVLGINVQQLQKSALWKQFVEPQMAKNADFVTKMQQFKDKCGFDPMASITSVSAGLKAAGDNADGIVVFSGLDKTKSLTCLDKNKAEMEKDGTSYTTDGDVTLIKNKKGETVAAHFVNDTTLVMGVGALGNTAAVKAAAAGTSTLKSSPQFVDMYGKINTSDSMWGLANCASKALADLKKANISCKAIFGSVNVTDGITTDVRIRATSPDQASTIETLAKSQAGQLQPFVDKLDISVDASDVKMAIVISQQKLQTLMQLAKAGMGGADGP